MGENAIVVRDLNTNYHGRDFIAERKKSLREVGVIGGIYWSCRDIDHQCGASTDHSVIPRVVSTRSLDPG